MAKNHTANTFLDALLTECTGDAAAMVLQPRSDHRWQPMHVALGSRRQGPDTLMSILGFSKSEKFTFP